MRELVFTLSIVICIVYVVCCVSLLKISFPWRISKTFPKTKELPALWSRKADFVKVKYKIQKRNSKKVIKGEKIWHFKSKHSLKLLLHLSFNLHIHALNIFERLVLVLAFMIYSVWKYNQMRMMHESKIDHLFCGASARCSGNINQFLQLFGNKRRALRIGCTSLPGSSCVEWKPRMKLPSFGVLI